MTKGLLFVLAGALLFGCGGGGSTATGSVQEELQSFNLGYVRGDTPTTKALTLAKPFYPGANVELGAAPTGGFAPVAGMLPMVVATGSQPVTLWITFDPPASPASAVQEGSIQLLFHRVDNGQTVPVTVFLRAQIETPSVRVLQANTSAGRAAIGETVDFDVAIENTSAVTPITVTDVTPPSGEFSISPNAFPLPLQVAPGSRFVARLRYAPQNLGTATSGITVVNSASADPLEATVSGTGIPARMVIDYGDVPLDPVTFESDWLTLAVPPEGVGIFLEAWGDPALSLIDLTGFEGPGGAVYWASDMTGPLGWLANYPAGALGYLNIELPNSDLPAVQLVPGGGTYRFRVRDSAFATGTLHVRATISQRGADILQEGTLKLRVFLADGLGIADPGQPMSDAKLSEVMTTIDAILGMSGVRLGEVTFVFMDPAYDTVNDETETGNLIAANTYGLEEGSLNLFFVNQMTYGVAAVAGGVPGPTTNGTPYSGVVVGFGQGNAVTVGAMAAAEIAHYLGHFDPADEGALLLPGEAYPVLRHPILDAGNPADLLSPPETDLSQLIATVNQMAPISTWSSTYERTPLR